MSQTTAPVDLSILMPAYNEERTIERAVEEVLAVDYPVERFELVVVENGSTDGTRKLLTDRRWPGPVRVIAVSPNRGKGGAVRTAIGAARGRWSVILDADLEYDAADIPSVIQPLVSGEAEAVFGVRGFSSHTSYGFWYVMGGKAVNLAANVLYNSWLSDITTCMKACPTELFRELALRERTFTIDAEIPAHLLRRGIRIHEVPVRYRARSREEGKKLHASDGVRLMWTLLRCRFE
jgi:dolichol-phosphate hexosyltransferase